MGITILQHLKPKLLSAINCKSDIDPKIVTNQSVVADLHTLDDVIGLKNVKYIDHVNSVYVSDVFIDTLSINCNAKCSIKDLVVVDKNFYLYAKNEEPIYAGQNVELSIQTIKPKDLKKFGYMHGYDCIDKKTGFSFRIFFFPTISPKARPLKVEFSLWKAGNRGLSIIDGLFNCFTPDKELFNIREAMCEPKSIARVDFAVDVFSLAHISDFIISLKPDTSSVRWHNFEGVLQSIQTYSNAGRVERRAYNKNDEIHKFSKKKNVVDSMYDPIKGRGLHVTRIEKSMFKTNKNIHDIASNTRNHFKQVDVFYVSPYMEKNLSKGEVKISLDKDWLLFLEISRYRGIEWATNFFFENFSPVLAKKSANRLLKNTNNILCLHKCSAEWNNRLREHLESYGLVTGCGTT